MNQNEENAWKKFFPPPSRTSTLSPLHYSPLIASVINSSCKRLCQPRDLDISSLNALICSPKITQHARALCLGLANFRFFSGGRSHKLKFNFRINFIKVMPSSTRRRDVLVDCIGWGKNITLINRNKERGSSTNFEQLTSSMEFFHFCRLVFFLSW